MFKPLPCLLKRQALAISIRNLEDHINSTDSSHIITPSQMDTLHSDHNSKEVTLLGFPDSAIHPQHSPVTEICSSNSSLNIPHPIFPPQLVLPVKYVENQAIKHLIVSTG
jgi:hypothetical protein